MVQVQEVITVQCRYRGWLKYLAARKPPPQCIGKLDLLWFL